MEKNQGSVRLETILRRLLFTSRDARELGIHPASLHYYMKKGRLRRVARGVYQSTCSESTVDFRWQDLIEAVFSVKDGVVCLLSALALYDLTEEIPRQHWICIPHSTSATVGSHVKIVRSRNALLGKTTMQLGEISLPIFDRERTIVDAFRLLAREVAVKALKIALQRTGADRIDLIRLQEYAKKLRVNIDPYLIAILA